jgi:hypothetical protein
MVSGTLGTPRDVASYSKAVQVQGQTVYLMDPGVSFISKVQALMTRKAKWITDMSDLKFLLRKYPDRIHAVKDLIPYNLRVELVNEFRRHGSSLVDDARRALGVR